MDPLNYYTDETQVFERKSIDSDYFKNEKSITYKNLKNTLNTRYKFLAAGINNDSKDTNINPFKFSRPEIEEKSPTSSPKCNKFKTGNTFTIMYAYENFIYKISNATKCNYCIV